jgi:predicted nuclease of predicted toxin-antitoxin system
VKLLLDYNLSPQLVALIADLCPGSAHIRSAGFAGETPDEVIWQYARENGFALLTCNYDFLDFTRRYGSPPQLIHLEEMNYPTRVAAGLLRAHALAISVFEKSNGGVLRLRPRWMEIS